jgi:hypothetical protein
MVNLGAEVGGGPGDRGLLGKAKWLSVVDMGGNLDDLGHRSWWWTWGGANGQGQVVFGS